MCRLANIFHTRFFLSFFLSHNFKLHKETFLRCYINNEFVYLYIYTYTSTYNKYYV